MNRREHLWTVLQEEAAEIIQQVSKIKRFGLANHQPASGKLNLELIHDEFNDFLAVIEMLQDEGIPLWANIDKIKAKKKKVEQFLEISRQEGTLK